MLDPVPDLRPTLAAATPDELLNLFEVFDVAAEYNKPNRRLKARRHGAPGLIPPRKDPDRRAGGRGILS
jgi:hypothetical protein